MIICNATPLIAFARIQRLDILHQVIGEIVIPQGVADEIRHHHGGKYATIDLARESWITVQPVQSESDVQLLLPSLDRGEAEVIVTSRIAGIETECPVASH